MSNPKSVKVLGTKYSIIYANAKDDESFSTWTPTATVRPRK